MKHPPHTAHESWDEERVEHRPRARKELWLEGLFITALWGSMALLTIAQRALDPRHGGPGFIGLGEVFHVLSEYGLWAILTPVTFWLSRQYRLEGTKWISSVLIHVLVAFTIAILMNAFAMITFEVLVPGARRFAFSFGRSLVNLYFLDELIIYLVVLAAGFARDYFLRYRERLKESAALRVHAGELQAQLAEARLHALRMQINPHFLFNTLHAISTYIDKDPVAARRMIARLSELLRYTLDKTSAREVPLRQELDFISKYLEIQKTRFGDRLRVLHDIDPDVREALVPNLILQPLVENAIKHGVSNKEGQGVIELKAWKKGEYLYLSVADNGPGLVTSGDGAPQVGNGIGLRNTRQRLEGLYGSRQSLKLESAAQGGLAAQICLPFHTSADLFTVAVEN